MPLINHNEDYSIDDNNIFYHSFFDTNNNINNFNDEEYIYNYFTEEESNIQNNQIDGGDLFRINSNNFFSYNNHILGTNSTTNENSNTFSSFNNRHISWLNKDKFTEDIIKKYENNNLCTICQENFKLNEEVYIAKCKHIFHYKCTEDAINNNILDCPNCRCDLKTGKKKKVINSNRNINLFNNNIFNTYSHEINKIIKASFLFQKQN